MLEGGDVSCLPPPRARLAACNVEWSHFAPTVVTLQLCHTAAVADFFVAMRTISALLLLACVLMTVGGFQVSPPSSCALSRKFSVLRQMEPLPLLSLQMSNRPDDEDQNVRVDLVEDVDSFSLTAIGFALIAFNFLVLANLGDGGIGGLVARFINFWNS